MKMDVKARKMPNNEENVYDSVKLDNIPKFSDLKSEVNVILKQSSWWDFYGVDWAINGIFLALLPVSLLLIRSEEWLYIGLGIFLLGWIHSVLATKCGHLAAHGSLSGIKALSRPLSVLFVEVIGTFSEELTYDIHIKEHHPYTNIVGIGDSSTWKVPFLPRYVYMFMAPVLLPPFAIILSIAGLLEKRSYFGVMKFLIRAGCGLFIIIYFLMTVSHCSLWGAVAVVWASRATLTIPYIHVNIFQHIGLPMYAKESKPVRLYQMATGVLNLPSNPVLDYAFGHSIISCHVEHHLFPQLSDNMCLKIKPVVSKFLKNSSLPYNEKTYMNRLSLFLDKYDTLMVNAPPITHFVGIQ